jgi:uncharacterized membrane protein YhaH (DUF805 family)
MWVVFQFLIGIGFVILMMVLGGAAMLSAGGVTDPTQMMAVGGVILVLYLLMLLVSLAFLIPSIAVTVRRLHDTNRSGWWVMLYWGPLLVMFVIPFVVGADLASGGTGMAGGALAMITWLVWLVGCLTLLVFMFLEGTKGPNQYGPDPKGADTGQVFA